MFETLRSAAQSEHEVSPIPSQMIWSRKMNLVYPQNLAVDV